MSGASSGIARGVGRRPRCGTCRRWRDAGLFTSETSRVASCPVPAIIGCGVRTLLRWVRIGSVPADDVLSFDAASRDRGIPSGCALRAGRCCSLCETLPAAMPALRRAVPRATLAGPRAQKRLISRRWWTAILRAKATSGARRLICAARRRTEPRLEQRVRRLVIVLTAAGMLAARPSRRPTATERVEPWPLLSEAAITPTATVPATT